MLGRIGFRRPVDHDVVGVSRLFAGRGIEQPHDGLLESFRTVHGVDAHRVTGVADDAFVRGFLGSGVREIRELVQKPRQARIPARVRVERALHESLQIGEHRSAHRFGHGRLITPHHVAFEIDAVELIVHRQNVALREPPLEQTVSAAQCGARSLLARETHEPRPPRIAGDLRNRDQVLVAAAEDRRTQNVRQAQVRERRDQEFEQRHHVLRFQRRKEPALTRSDVRNGRGPQRLLVDGEVRAPLDEDHDVLVARRPRFAFGIVIHELPDTDDLIDSIDELPGLRFAAQVFVHLERLLKRDSATP